MPYANNSELPKAVRDVLPSKAQDVFRNVVNSQLADGKSEEVSFASAWGALSRQGWEKNSDGKWVHVAKANEDAKSRGVMVMLTIPSDIANKLAVDGGEPAKDLHITLAYLGKEDELPEDYFQTLEYIVDDIASDTDAISCLVREVEKFPATSNSDGKDVVYAEVESDSLLHLRHELCESLEKVGLQARNDFGGYTPHITLKYIEPGTSHNIQLPETMILFPSLGVSVGGMKKEFPFENTVRKLEDISTVIKFTSINADKRQVFGWASVANDVNGFRVVDHGNDVIKIDELEKASYNFVKNSRKAGEMHERIGVGTLIESMVFTREKQDILGISKGIMPEGWWVGFEVEQAVFDKIKDGTYQAFSIGGVGKRTLIGE